MALVTPIALPLNAFDSSNIQRFSFVASGGDTAFTKSKLTIKRQSDDSVVYTNKQVSYESYQDVPAGTLQNGVQYSFYFNTYDFDDNISEDSNTVLFWCYTEPTITFTNIPSSNVIKSVSYNFECTYDQIEGEKLESLVFKLYNNENVLIASSNPIYTTEEPPNNFEYTFTDLLENTRYYIEVTGATINGTAVSSDKVQFTVQYSDPIFYEKLKLQNNPDKGYINVYTNLIAIDGYSNKENPTIVDGMVDLSTYGDYVEWRSGFSIPKSFTMQILMKPCLLGKIMTLKNETESLEINIEFKREIPDNESVVKDCFYLRETNNNTHLSSCLRSNYIDIMNNNSYLCLWIKKIDTVYDLRLEEVSGTENIFNWNTVSNLEYNKVTDIYWGNENYSSATDVIVSRDFNSLFPLTKVRIRNGMFDNVYISKDITLNYTTEPLSEWDENTILCANFNDGINAGNIAVYVSQISKILIKRRASGENSWLTILEKQVYGLDDININIYDYFSPNKTNMEYALVPFVDGAESSYIISSIYSCFNGLYVTNGDETYKLYESVTYNGNKDSLRSGLHETLNGKYPIITYNSKLDYKSFTIEGLLLGYDFESTREINRKSVLMQTENLTSFLKNKKQKIIKDWNGNIYLGSIVDDVIPNVDLINGFNRISFNFVEQGKYNNQTDYDNSELVVK